MNDACVLLGKPNVYGSIFRFEGQASLFYAQQGPCYRCLFREPPPPGLVPSCAEGGVLGVLPAVIGSLQALETIKSILGVGETLAGRLLLFDALRLRFRELPVYKDPQCPLCGVNPTITELTDYETVCGVAGAAVPESAEVSAPGLARELRERQDVVLIDVREPHEWEICRIDGALPVPLSALAASLGALDHRWDIVTYCHKGIRSLTALQLLKTAGFAEVRSLRGGIDAWSRAVDPSVPRY